MKKSERPKYSIDQCALYMCRSKKRLAVILQISFEELKTIQQEIQYHSFEIDKKDSAEKRKITAPSYSLKRIQSRLLSLIKRIERPDWLISGEIGKSYITNGEMHIQSNYMLTMDIKKFYDNCRREGVYQFFLTHLRTSSDVAKILTDIVTYEKGIPTGCPTSQLIAYYAYEEMFNRIHVCAKKYRCIFTLYVDDMCFSSVTPFLKDNLAREVDLILREYGHKPKYRKVKYYSKKDSKPVTGTVITPDHSLAAPNALQKRIVDDFRSIKSDGEDDPEKILKESQSLLGRIQSVRNVMSVNGYEKRKFSEVERLTRQKIREHTSIKRK